MTYEEALLSCKLTCTQCQEIYKIQCHEDCATAYKINALEKQIPKKPIRKNEGEEDEWQKYAPWYVYICPNCGSDPRYLDTQEDYAEPQKYCLECGQALDWSE